MNSDGTKASVGVLPTYLYDIIQDTLRFLEHLLRRQLHLGAAVRLHECHNAGEV